MSQAATFDETRAALIWVPEPPPDGQDVGSGYFLTPSHVLSAGHVFGWREGLACEVRRHRTAADWAEATVVWVSQKHDVALLELREGPADSEHWDLPPLGQLAPNTRVAARLIGFPASEVFENEHEKRVRDSKGVEGTIDSETGVNRHRLSLSLTEPVPGHEGGDSPWGGISGAGIFSGTALVGVVIIQRADYGASVLAATPLAKLVAADGFAAALGLAKPPPLTVAGGAREPSYRATLRVIRDRTGVLIDREQELDRIAAFATGEADPFGPGTGARGYLWLVGGPWAGKSALMAEAVHTMPPNVDVVAYFLVARESRASQEHFLAAIVPQLAFLLDEDPPASPDVDTFRALWERAMGQSRHLLLVVDGLDEDLGPANHSVAALLPERPGPRARVLVASRPFPGMPERVDLPGDVDEQHPLHTAAAERVLLSDSAVGAERRILADQEIEALLSRLDESPEAELGLDVLGLLAAAAGALTVEDLAALTDARPRSIRKFLTTRAMRSLEAMGQEGRRRYRFAHQTLLERCRADPDVGDLSYRNRLTEWADEWCEKRWPPPDAAEGGTPHYLLDTYPAVLASSLSEAPRLADVASDIAWVDSAITTVGVSQVLATLRSSVEADASRPEVASMLRLVRLQSDRLRPPHAKTRAGYPATQLGWEALRGGLADVAAAAAERLRSCPGPQLIPEWTTERTSAGLIRTLGRHEGGVRALAVTAEGRVVSGGRDGALRLWDPADPDDPGRELGRHLGEWVRALAVTAEGRVVSGGDDGALRLWDPADPDDPGRELGRHLGERVMALAVTAEGLVVSGGDDGALRLWDPADPDDPGRELGRHLGERVMALAVTAEGRVVSGGDDGALRLWDPADPDDPGRELGRHEGGWVRALAVTAEGRVVSGGGDGALRLWDPADPDDPGRELGRHLGGWVMALAVTAEGRVVSGGDDGALRLWDPADPDDPGRELGRHLGERVMALAVTAEGRVVSGGGDGALRLWHPADPDDPGRELGRHLGERVRALAVTAEGLVVSGGRDGALRLWDPAEPDDPGRELGRHEGEWVMALAVTAEGRVVSGGGDGALRLWDPAEPDDPGRKLGRHERGVRALAVTAEGRVVSGGGDGALRLWDPAEPDDPGRELGRHERGVRALAVTAEGRVVSGGRDGALRLWDPADPDDPGRELGRHERGVRALAVTAEGRVVSGGGDGALRLWDPADPDDPGRELGRHERGVRALAVTAEGRVVVAAIGLTGFRLVFGA